MSEASTSPAGGDPRALDQLRHQAKLLLKQAKARDALVIAKLRELLPRLVPLDDAQVADSIRLADVQHAVARKLGHENWAAVKQLYERLDPIHTRAARFLVALRDDDTARAATLLDETPAIARYSIHTAAAAGDLEAVRAFLEADPACASRPDATNGLVPLIYAVSADLKQARRVSAESQLELARALLDAGADPNSSSPLAIETDAIPALYFPCVHGNVPIARLLLERGARPTDGESLYHAAQHDHRAVLALLVEFGADPSHGPTADGNTPLHFLVAHTAGQRTTASALRGMTWLLNHGADPNVPSYPGRTDHPQAGETPLHRAVSAGHAREVLADLVAHGARIDTRRDDGATAYQLAWRAANHDAVAYLASIGADATLSPLDRLLGACLAHDETAARAELARHPDLLSRLDQSARDALGIALARGNHDAVRLMVTLGWPLDQQGEWGGTPLHWAAWNGLVEMVRLLVEAGAPINVRDSRYGSSPIAWCAHGSTFCDRANDDDYPAIIHLLLDAGATRPESYNQWNEAPETLARPSVVAAMRARGFAV